MEILTGTFHNLRNILAKTTLGGQVLDLIITDAHEMYDKAEVFPPIQPDRPGHGAHSDHSVAIAKPNRDKSHHTGFARVITKTRTVVTPTNLIMLSLYLSSYPWQALYDAQTVDKIC